LLDDDSPWRLRFNRIHQDIRDRITLQQYPSGMRLDLDALAREFDVSRTPVRSVLQRLEYEGLVDTKHGVGTMVAEFSSASWKEDMSLRAHLARLIGELTPHTPPDAMADELDGLIHRMNAMRTTPNPEEFASIDLAYQKCFSELIGNEALLKSYSELYYRTARMWANFLPFLNWKTELSIFTETMTLARDAAIRKDARSIGQISGGAITQVVFRLGDF